MNSFNIRVYGLLIDTQNGLLLSDEFIRGDYITKFPGGGLELGEGTKECLVREFKEETGLDVEVGDHFYTTDFVQQSAFDSTQQIISIYYFVKCKSLASLNTHISPFDFAPSQVADANGSYEIFRWIDWKDITTACVTLPIDKKVVALLLENQSGQNLFQNKNYFIQQHPFVVPTTDGKLIEEYFGIGTTEHSNISIAHMVAPPGWSEPYQKPEFDEWTIIISGKKSIEIDGESITLHKGECILIRKGAKIKYSNPFDVACEYWSICLPAFSLERVHRS